MNNIRWIDFMKVSENGTEMACHIGIDEHTHTILSGFVNGKEIARFAVPLKGQTLYEAIEAAALSQLRQYLRACA